MNQVLGVEGPRESVEVPMEDESLDPDEDRKSHSNRLDSLSPDTRQSQASRRLQAAALKQQRLSKTSRQGNKGTFKRADQNNPTAKDKKADRKRVTTKRIAATNRSF